MENFKLGKLKSIKNDKERDGGRDGERESERNEGVKAIETQGDEYTDGQQKKEWGIIRKKEVF